MRGGAIGLLKTDPCILWFNRKDAKVHGFARRNDEVICGYNISVIRFSERTLNCRDHLLEAQVASSFLLARTLVHHDRIITHLQKDLTGLGSFGAHLFAVDVSVFAHEIQRDLDPIDLKTHCHF